MRIIGVVVCCLFSFLSVEGSNAAALAASTTNKKTEKPGKKKSIKNGKTQSSVEKGTKPAPTKKTVTNPVKRKKAATNPVTPKEAVTNPVTPKKVTKPAVVKKGPVAKKVEVSEHLLIPGVRGFVNLNNTCFFAALMQVLLHAEPFIEYFKSFDYLPSDSMEAKVVNAVLRLIDMQWSAKENVLGKAFRPVVLFKTIRKYFLTINKRAKELKPDSKDGKPGANTFVIGVQQDATEAYGFLLDAIKGSINKLLADGDLDNTMVGSLDVFDFETSVLKHCPESPIEENIQTNSLLLQTIPDTKDTVLLNIRDEFKLENRVVDCGQERTMIPKSIRMRTMPKLLMVKANRDMFDQVTFEAGKIKSIVKASLDIILASVEKGVLNSVHYRLIGIVYHHGEDAKHGHYTSSFRHLNNLWYYADDSDISLHKDNIPNLLSTESVLYLYQKMD